MLNSLSLFINQYNASIDKQKGIRMGQYFCNKFVKESGPQLFYSTDDNKSKQMIEEWLIRYCYEAELPLEKR